VLQCRWYRLGASFAHKTTEGWEALLSGMIRGGWTITGSWPIATEMAASNAGPQIPPPCDQRPPHLSPATRRRKSATGPTCCASCLKRVGDWMERLQGEGRARRRPCLRLHRPGARDLQPLLQELRPPMGARYALAEYLEKVWEVVGRSALAQVLGTAEASARNGASWCRGGRRAAYSALSLDAPELELPSTWSPSSARPTRTKNPDVDDDEDEASRSAEGGASRWSST
jgi:putative DNA methylase